MEVNELSKNIRAKHGVLLLELADNESDPNMICPTVISTSLRQVKEKRLKQVFKGEHATVLLEAWSAVDTELAARALFDEGYRGLMECPVESKTHLVCQMLLMHTFVGGVFRLFFNANILKERLEEPWRMILFLMKRSIAVY
jgi:hypothetical protein